MTFAGRIVTSFLLIIFLFLSLLFTGCTTFINSTLISTSLPEPIAILDKILYEDDFSNAKSGWAAGPNDYGDFYYESGEYSLLHFKSGASMCATAPSKSLTDFAVEVDVRALSTESNGYWGINFRKIGSNYYVLYIKDGSFKLSKRINEEWQTLQSWQKSNDILGSPETNKIKIACLGSQIDIYVNGQRLGSYTDSSFTEGKLGLVSAQENTHVHFDNLKVYAVNGSSALARAAIPVAATESYAKAIQYGKSGDLNAAIGYYEKAIQSYAMYSAAWNGKGVVLLELGQYANALYCFKNATAIDPENSDAWVNEGECLEALGNNDAAISCYNQALKVNEGNIKATADKEKLVSSGVADKKVALPAKEYGTPDLTVTGPVMTITLNEGAPFSTTLTAKNGQTQYYWFLTADNGIADNICLSYNEAGDTLTVSGTAAYIADSTTESRFAFVEVRAEDSSQLTRKGDGSFQLHVMNIIKTSTPVTVTTGSTATGNRTLDGIWIDTTKEEVEEGVTTEKQTLIVLFKPDGKAYFYIKEMCLDPNNINENTILKDTSENKYTKGFGWRGPLGEGEKYYWEYSISGDILTMTDKCEKVPGYTEGKDSHLTMLPNGSYNKTYKWRIKGDTIQTSWEYGNLELSRKQ